MTLFVLGFLLNERFVNIPAKISVVMLNSLYDELERIKKKDKSYEFEYFVLICKTSKPKGETGKYLIRIILFLKPQTFQFRWGRIILERRRRNVQ